MLENLFYSISGTKCKPVRATGSKFVKSPIETALRMIPVCSTTSLENVETFKGCVFHLAYKTKDKKQTEISSHSTSSATNIFLKSKFSAFCRNTTPHKACRSLKNVQSKKALFSGITSDSLRFTSRSIVTYSKSSMKLFLNHK